LFPNHKQIRKRLSTLPKLKKIAFNQDSYKGFNMPERDGQHSDFWGAYYSDKYLSPQQEADSGLEPSYNTINPARSRVWEICHKRRMIRQAEKYAANIPDLEWIYIGQYQMHVVRASRGIQLVPLSEHREDVEATAATLQGIFGWKGVFHRSRIGNLDHRRRSGLDTNF
jgi:hypothetical protein